MKRRLRLGEIISKALLVTVIEYMKRFDCLKQLLLINSIYPDVSP